MPEFVVVCKVDDVPEGSAKQFKVNGTEIALAHVQGAECYAIGGRCTHLRAPLGKGSLEGTVLTCPWHASQFEVTTGNLLRWVQEPPLWRILGALVPPFLRRGVPSYEVKIEDGQVLVKI